MSDKPNKADLPMCKNIPPLDSALELVKCMMSPNQFDQAKNITANWERGPVSLTFQPDKHNMSFQICEKSPLGSPQNQRCIEFTHDSLTDKGPDGTAFWRGPN